MPRIVQADSDILDTLRLTPRDAEALLDKLQTRRDAFVGSDQRRSQRVFFTSISGINAQVTHPGGSNQNFLVLPTDLSAGGICVLHGGYLHAGSSIRLWVPDRAGYERQVTGKTVRCTYFQAMIHEIGVMFDEPIHLSEFTTAGEESNGQAPMSKLVGQILYAEDSLDFRELMRFHLLDIGVEVLVSASGQETVRMATDIEVDAVIVDISLPDIDGIEVVRQLRANGFGKAIYLAVPEQSDDIAEHAAEAGATQLMIKPTPKQTLHDQLADVLSIGADAASLSDVIYSEHWSDLRMRPLIGAFLERLEKQLPPLSTPPSITDTRRDAWKAQAQDLRTSAAGYGFPHIAEAAGELVKIDPGDQALFQQSFDHLQQLVQRAVLVVTPKGTS